MMDKASIFPAHLAVDTRIPTFENIDESLRRWIKFYESVLMAAAIHALGLPRDISRATTHALWLKLHHGGTLRSPPSKQFRIADANVVALSDVALLGKDEWKETLELFSAMRDRSMAANKGGMAIVIIECPPLGLQILPVGSLLEGELRGGIISAWKSILIRHVEKGERVLKFGDGKS